MSYISIYLINESAVHYRYEGLTQVNVPHNKGVMVFGSGTGAGIQAVKPFDKYGLDVCEARDVLLLKEDALQGVCQGILTVY